MNFNLDRSYPLLALRGRPTDPLRLPTHSLTRADLATKSWPHNAMDFYIWLDVAVGECKRELRDEVRRVRELPVGQSEPASAERLAGQLQEWLRITKKMEFYHIDTNNKELFYADHGLLRLYQSASLRCIYLLSEIQKYRVKNAEEDTLTLADLRKDEVEIIYRDVCLKISRHLLSELRNEMYYPSRELVTKLLKFYGFTYDYSKSFLQNYQAALADKKVTAGDSREATIILFTFKMITAFHSLPDTAAYIAYLKNVLLDRSNGVLTAEYETWLLLYETCLKLFSRYEALREDELIEIDQILSSNFVDGEFQAFLVRNAEAANVTLSSINFYIKNCKREDKEELKPCVLAKIDKLMTDNFWKYLEDIFEYIENELEPEQRDQYVQRIMRRVAHLTTEEISTQKLYEVEYGLTFILENLGKYVHEFTEVMPLSTLAEMAAILKANPTQEKTTILFRYFSQFITVLYSETSYEAMDLPPATQLLELSRLFQSKNLLCHKSVYKLIYYQLCSEEHGEEDWESFFAQVAELYFCGGYEENSDLEIIHSHESYRECLASKILQSFQLLICAQITERRELTRCLEGECGAAAKQAYFAVRGFKDGLLFESIQNICLIFNSHLSMQTLEFGLNYCTPFAFLAPWHPEESELSLLSLICEEMPIETLKFIFKEVTEHSLLDTHALETVSPLFWSRYWREDRRECASVFLEVNMEKLEALQRLRRLEFILSLACCVFDKLNENSQKNIKEIKIIYDHAALKIIEVASKLKRPFLEALNLAVIRKIDGLSGEEVRNLQVVDEDSGCFILTNYIHENGFLSIAKEFNLIGKVNQSQKVVELEEALLPTLRSLKFAPAKPHELIYKQIELCLNIEASYLKKIVDSPDGFLYEVEVSKEWAKHILTNATALTALVKREAGGEKDGMGVLSDKINSHIKCLLSKVLVPEVLGVLLGEGRSGVSKQLLGLLRGSIELIYAIDSDYEEHFIVAIEKLEQLGREGKEGKRGVQGAQLLGLLEVLFELIFNRVRIRSYHLYRIIKFYQRATAEPAEQFNTVIAGHIRVLFEEFITNYKSIGELTQLCAPKRALNPLYGRFARQDHALSYIETACTLSMFINLFCRLNYPSLTVGVEKIFSEEEAKAIYIDYLASLTRKIVTEHIAIAPRDLEILKIDVYGNLNLITQGKLSERLMNKLISLAKNLLRLKVDLKGVNKLPIKILADKIAAEQLEINLEEFEDECKAISLGAISLHNKLAVYVNSNLHLCNIYYLTGRNFEKYIDLNHAVLGRNRQEMAAEVGKVARLGLAAARVEVGEEVGCALEGLMRKVEKYYEVCTREAEYAEKLYGIFKILCISCLNNPEILPFLLAQRLTINKTPLSFLDFVFLTLKLCLPLFCEFYTTLIKTNAGFIQLSPDQTISCNLEYELTVRRRLLGLLKSEITKKESEYVHLTKAITFVQQYSECNRFRFYKFVKNANEPYENVLKEYEREFNMELIRTCDQYIRSAHSAFSTTQVYELLETSLERTYANGNALDLRKLANEEHIRRHYYSHKHNAEHNKENMDTERRSRENQTARSKQHDTTTYRPLLAQVLQAATAPLARTTKGKKPRDAKQLRLNSLQEDLISINDCKAVLADWTSKTAKPADVNRIMVEKFMLFNEEIESREFLKDAIIFPSRNGLEVLPRESVQLLKGDAINEDEQEDGCIESIDDIKEDEEINFSEKIIEESQPMELEGGQFEQRGSDSIIYSEIEIDNNEDGSMKLFGQADEEPAQEDTQQEVSKDDIVALIEDYTLNPEAIKQIALRIKFLPTPDLEKLKGQHAGEVAYVVEAELRNRGIASPPESNVYEYFFVDESKIYDRMRNRREDRDKEVVIPQFSRQFLGEWLRMMLRAGGEERLATATKRLSSFCRRMLLELPNIDLLVAETLSLLTMDNNQFELTFQELPFTKKTNADYYKQVLVDHVFGVMVESRIALPIIFYGCWDATGRTVLPRAGQTDKLESIMEILLMVVLRCGEKESAFLRGLVEYFQALNKVTKYQYPYLQVQDSVGLSLRVVEQLSQKMHLTCETFSDNPKLLTILRAMLFLQVKTYQQLLSIELAKAADAVKKSYQKEEHVMQLFRKNYSAEEGLQLERKAEIYWQLRKSKNADEHNAEVVFCRRMVTDLASVVLERVKETCFALYYKADELSMKEELLYLRRKLQEARHYAEKNELELEFREKEKRYCFWRRNLLNLIIVEEIVPAVEEVSGDFLEQLRQTTELLSFLYGDFHPIAKATPIIFRQAAEYYKLMLGYELLKREEEQTYHSMSTLKTIPSIQSTRQVDALRRRSSLIRHSIFQIACVDTAAIAKKSALMLSLDALALEPNNPLFAVHARNADMETKLTYLRQENKLGEKVIEVNRQSLWSDTAVHLDDNFGNYDIKIKIAGELGIDYGGVTREWVSLVVKEILDPRLGLFELNVNGLAFQPSRFSYLVPNHLETFHKFGIFVGKAMKENWLLELNFTKSFLKHMLGALLYVEDLEDLEPDTAKGLLWILKNYVDEDLGLTFTYEEEVLESKRTVELVPGGTEVFVNELNKKEYVKKLAYTKMTESIREQSLAFISGVEKVVPIQMLKLFNYREMGKYFAGVSTINVAEMRQFAKYEGYSEDNQNVQWFWEVMGAMSEEDKAEFLFFLTGSYRVPYSGFKENPITINKMNACKDYLPVAHTCFSIIDLPEYSSRDKLERTLVRAVKEGKGFTVS